MKFSSKESKGEEVVTEMSEKLDDMIRETKERIQKLKL